MPSEVLQRRPEIRVVIADDHAVVREGIRHVLSSEADFTIVGEATTGEEAIVLVDRFRPDVIVLDLSMPGLSGLAAAERIRETAAGTRILVLSIHDHEEYVRQSIQAGAHGYLRKDSSPAELRNAIRVVAEGASFFGAPVARTLSSALQNESRLSNLTPRERDVLAAIAQGETSKEIAGRFGISVRTVESHREALAKKLGLRGVASLTRFAIDAGVIRISTEP